MRLGLNVAAGHELTYRNVGAVGRIREITEFQYRPQHHCACDFCGVGKEAVREMRAAITKNSLCALRENYPRSEPSWSLTTDRSISAFATSDPLQFRSRRSNCFSEPFARSFARAASISSGRSATSASTDT